MNNNMNKKPLKLRLKEMEQGVRPSRALAERIIQSLADIPVLKTMETGGYEESRDDLLRTLGSFNARKEVDPNVTFGQLCDYSWYGFRFQYDRSSKVFLTCDDAKTFQDILWDILDFHIYWLKNNCKNINQITFPELRFSDNRIICQFLRLPVKEYREIICSRKNAGDIAWELEALLESYHFSERATIMDALRILSQGIDVEGGLPRERQLWFEQFITDPLSLYVDPAFEEPLRMGKPEKQEEYIDFPEDFWEDELPFN